MKTVTGRRTAAPLPRVWIDDLMIASRGVPAITFERRMALADLRAAREQAPDRPAWVVLFVKAYAAVAARRPELRRSYQPLPWPHFWTSDQNIASVAVERQYRGEPAVFFGLVREPQLLPLQELQRLLRHWQTTPVEKVRPFAKLIRYTKLPRPVRRLCWWHGRDFSGTKRANTFGTFGVSVTAGSGATALNLISPLATTLNYGLFADDGGLDVRLHFDHRVLDGANVARVLTDLEAELSGPILDEVRGLKTAPRVREVDVLTVDLNRVNSWSRPVRV